MLIRRRRGWEIPDREATPEALFMDRRRFLEGATALGGLLVGAACDRGFADGPISAPPPALAAQRSPKWLHDGGPTDVRAVVRYNNFYEFSQDKDVWRHVEKFETRPWTVEVSGLVGKPKTWDIDEIRKLPLEERLYRHRCVEAWYMDVPWIGVPLSTILRASEPLPKARYVKFVSFLKKDQAPGQKNFSWYRWPYYEGLRLDEAMNEMTLATVGIYGHELPRQNGAPFRVVVPWKYGYKGPKSVVKIELVEKQPGTFWNDLEPAEYSFESNVNPKIPHPRWSQATERSIDGARSRPTRLYNGYEAWVGSLYRG
jgi:methionine sulfoxide reductase catalytic subunit